MKHYILSICIVFLATAVTHAQHVTGQLVDYDNHPLVGANVLLLSKVDSVYMAGTVTGDDGKFVLASGEDGGILMFSYIRISQCVSRYNGRGCRNDKDAGECADA